MIWNDRIKQLREHEKMTLKQVAEYLGVSEGTAQRYESNAIKNIPYEMIIKYAKLFNKSPCYIMGWLEEEDLSLSFLEKQIVKKYRDADAFTKGLVIRSLGLDEEFEKEKERSNFA